MHDPDEKEEEVELPPEVEDALGDAIIGGAEDVTVIVYDN